MSAQPEFRLQCVVVDWLAAALPSRALYTAFPAGENRSPVTGARLKRMGVKRGWADILIFVDGKLIGIELKSPRGPVSDEQAAFGDALVANGGHYTIARSLDAVEAFLLACGVDLKARVV